MPLRIESVRHLSKRADVWDITVPDVECFALANGAIVHNCADAFGLMCVVHQSSGQLRDYDYEDEDVGPSGGY